MRIWSVAWKDIQILLRDRGALVVSFLLPLVFVLAFSLPHLAGTSTEEALITLPVVNLDQDSVASQEFIEALHTAGGVAVHLYPQQEAQDLLEAGEVDWLLEIPADFSAMSLEHPVTLRLVTHPDADEAEAESVQLAIEGVARDTALKYQLIASFEHMGAMMQAAPAEYREVFNTEVYLDQAESQLERSKTRPLVAVEQVVPETEGEEIEFTGTQVIIPGFTVLFVFLTAQTTAQSIFEEKRRGSFRRLLAAPIGRASLLAGKMVPTLALTLLQIVVVFAVGAWLFPLIGLDRLALGNNPLALVVVSLLVALCSTGLGLLIAALAQSETQVGGLSAVVLWVAAAIGGSFFPTFLMSGLLKTLSLVVPHSWALRAYNDVLVYGRGLAGILPELSVLLGFAGVFFLIGLWQFDFD